MDPNVARARLDSLTTLGQWLGLVVIFLIGWLEFDLTENLIFAMFSSSTMMLGGLLIAVIGDRCSLNKPKVVENALRGNLALLSIIPTAIAILSLPSRIAEPFPLVSLTVISSNLGITFCIGHLIYLALQHERRLRCAAGH